MGTGLVARHRAVTEGIVEAAEPEAERLLELVATDEVDVEARDEGDVFEDEVSRVRAVWAVHEVLHDAIASTHDLQGCVARVNDVRVFGGFRVAHKKLLASRSGWICGIVLDADSLTREQSRAIIAKSGRDTAEDDESGDTAEDDESGDTAEDDESGDTAEDDESGDTAEDDESGDTAEDDESGDTAEDDESGDTAEDDESGDTAEDDESGDTAEDDESGDTAEDDESGDTAEDDESGDTAEDDESGDTAEDDESGDTAEDDESGDTAEDDESGQTAEDDDESDDFWAAALMASTVCF
ncbi:hypothetical protein OCS_05863 [Ophiocordyceps sinensis CO18]|uniref:Uncharacterized protein n=1 Tax=Ophiocordyceps sinensis (strain Co18 / CGMCC 3.14243) TaxID=911162 RepID=T5A7N0_OPHSC|nr:hypothetical protein OCS_05863 [Ophiocordyceps sinensis CO18]